MGKWSNADELLNHRDRYVWNVDNADIFKVRFYQAKSDCRKSYMRGNRLWYYCQKAIALRQNASRVFCAFGNLGILDFPDLIEARSYIYSLNPNKIYPGMIGPAIYAMMIDVLEASESY